jgi:hypothetical protein
MKDVSLFPILPKREDVVHCAFSALASLLYFIGTSDSSTLERLCRIIWTYYLYRSRIAFESALAKVAVGLASAKPGKAGMKPKIIIFGGVKLS